MDTCLEIANLETRALLQVRTNVEVPRTLGIRLLWWHFQGRLLHSTPLVWHLLICFSQREACEQEIRERDMTTLPQHDLDPCVGIQFTDVLDPYVEVVKASCVHVQMCHFVVHALVVHALVCGLATL